MPRTARERHNVTTRRLKWQKVLGAYLTCPFAYARQQSLSHNVKLSWRLLVVNSAITMVIHTLQRDVRQSDILLAYALPS